SESTVPRTRYLHISRSRAQPKKGISTLAVARVRSTDNIGYHQHVRGKPAAKEGTSNCEHNQKLFKNCNLNHSRDTHTLWDTETIPCPHTTLTNRSLFIVAASVLV
ncbi:unnamed protein product, partial [Ectocarpus sp. 12 AP-2014]